MSKWEVGLTEISGSLDLTGACGAELTLVRDRRGEPFLVDSEYWTFLDPARAAPVFRIDLGLAPPEA